MTQSPGGDLSTGVPSGRQVEITSEDQRAWVVEVGGGLRAYSAHGREVLDGYAAQEMCSSARGQCLLAWPNRIRDGRYEFAGSRQQLPLTEPERQNAIHGLTRWANWTVAEQAAERVVMELAERFAHEGAAVAIDYLGHGEDAQALARDLSAAGAKAAAIEVDVTNAAAVEALVAQILERFGRLDILVNNAGIEKSQPLLEIDEASWDRTLAVDLKGPFLCLQAAARRMKDTGGGSIVNISSIHEDFPFPSYTPYAAAKGGLRMLMRNAALELAPLGIRVNNIAPGAIATPINAATLADPAKVQRLAEIVPLQRMGKPEEVAEVALFLASERSSYVTGSTYSVDGGIVRHAEAL